MWASIPGWNWPVGDQLWKIWSFLCVSLLRLFSVVVKTPYYDWTQDTRLNFTPQCKTPLCSWCHFMSCVVICCMFKLRGGKKEAQQEEQDHHSNIVQRRRWRQLIKSVSILCNEFIHEFHNEPRCCGARWWKWFGTGFNEENVAEIWHFTRRKVWSFWELWCFVINVLTDIFFFGKSVLKLFTFPV